MSDPIVVCFDLDDTLYKERDYVASAYAEVAARMAAHSGCQPDAVLRELIWAFEQGEPAFQYVEEHCGVACQLDECLSIYRNHIPRISLTPGVSDLLAELKEHGCVLGLITNGRSVTQRHKIQALRLMDYFDEENIVISEEFGTEKPSVRNFLYFSERYPGASCCYVGNNEEKDFLAPNRLGWKSVCLLDDGRNIRPQRFELSAEYLPQFSIRSFRELPGLLSLNAR